MSEKQEWGIRVGDDKLCCFLYADNIVIMNECGEETQRMLDVVSGYGIDLDKLKVIQNKE